MTNRQAVKYLQMLADSLDPNTAPRFSRQTIEAERDKARQAVAIAVQALGAANG